METQNHQSLQDVVSLHPHQYLTQLNAIYSQCNKSNTKSYSSVSKMKLEWKPFTIMKIPKCFELTYQKYQKNDQQNKKQPHQEMDENQKKIWKEHEQIINKYSKRKDQNKKILRPHSTIGRKLIKNSDQGRSLLPFDLSNLLIKRMQDNGAKMKENKESVKKEVMSKLKKIHNQGKRSKIWRAQSANYNTKNEGDLQKNEESIKRGSYYFNDQPYIGKQWKNVDENQFLLYHKSSDLLESYKKKIQQVDCAISQKNVKKTTMLLRNMENIIQHLD